MTGPTQLVVLGMHRSGTSGVTRLLNMAGAWFGPDGIATEANEENPRGFWERRDVRAVCDGLLHAGGFDWWRLSGFSAAALPAEARDHWLGAFEEILVELNDNRPWVVKEPRLCLLFPLVKPLLDAPVCIHVTREPLEVAQSVHRRNQFPMQAALALWELYTVRAFEASEGLPRILVRYEDLMADPVATTARLLGELEALGVAGLHQVPDADILGFISGDLHRQREESAARRGWLNQAQAELAARIDDGSVLGSGTTGQVSDAAVHELARLEQELDLLEQDLAALKENRALAERNAALLERETLLMEQRQELTQRTREMTDRIGGLEGRVADETQRREEQSSLRREAVRLAQNESRLREDQSRYREIELARRREIGRLADEALGTLDRQLERVETSHAGRIARGLVAARQVLTPGANRSKERLLDWPRQHLADQRREIQTRTRQEPAPRGGTTGSFDSGHALIRRSRPRRPRSDSDRPSVAVVSWDVGHNPLGRANVLAEVLARRFDVELWGAQFDRYGSEVWAPLREASTPVNVFPGMAFPEHLRTMEQVAERIDADALWVSKPRLPSYLLGIMAKQLRNRPLVLDVDDHELAFFNEDTGLDLSQIIGGSGPDDLTWPFERAWTRACDPFIDAADQVTVSNVALQQRYGGLIVPHARDEKRFDPDRYDRAQVRQRLGVGPDQRLLLFGGTPRAHKGVVEVLQALEVLGDDRYRVLMFGTREFDELRGRIGDLARWALVLPAQSFDALPELVAAADLACVIQDPAHPVSRYQMPAKVSDALAMGVPCLVTPTPPLAPLIAEGVLQVLEPGDQLPERIARVFDDHDDAIDRARRGRELFLRDFSYEAVADLIAPVFERLMADPPAVSPRLVELAEAPARAFAGAPGVTALPGHPIRLPRRARQAAPLADRAMFDVVMFWKQNDSGLYGRRQDMFLEELARSDRVGTIVHFDNPISPEALWASYRAGHGAADQRRLVARQSISRVLHRRDEPHIYRHTFVFGGQYSRRFRRPARAAYVDHVLSVLAKHRIGQRPVIVWAYPSNDDLPALIDAIAPDLVIADVVDDNRTWYQPGSAHITRIEENYAAVLARSDVVVANCAPVAESMLDFAEVVHVVPNGCEMPSGEPAGGRPRSLRDLSGPVITYVGNLSSRLDLPLIEAVARARPQWNFVFVGSAHLDRSIMDLDRLANVHFAGVMPYPEVRTFLRHVDVALIPHVDDEMTRSMNPLKAFVYAAAGVPVVSTPVANLADFDGLITVAADAEGFVKAIEAHLAAGRPVVDPEVLRPHSWTSRVDQVFELIDEAVGDPGSD